MATLLTNKTIYHTQPLNMNFVKPLSYDFRVVEWMKEGKVSKVTLQVQVWEHDEFGNGNLINTWTDVERIQIPLP